MRCGVFHVYDSAVNIVRSIDMGAGKEYNYTYDIKPEDTLFIDDSPKNIAGAESYGIHGYLFDGDAKKLEEYIFKKLK